MHHRSLRTSSRNALLFALSFCPVLVVAQSDQPASTGTPLTLRATTHLVVEDVLVTDAQNHPVTSLPRSAFHLTDDKHPQTIRSFEEATSDTAAHTTPSVLPPGTYSNAALADGSRTINVFFLDNVSIEVQDQMYLRIQALRAMSKLPPGTAAMVFRSSTHGAPVLMQSLTSDHALLAKAVENSVPALTTPVQSQSYAAIGSLGALSNYLAQFPGRKSLVWFAGKFPLFHSAVGVTGSSDDSAIQLAIRSTQRALQVARVAVFPIDVRGVLTTGGGLSVPQPPGINANGSMATQGAPSLQGEDAGHNGSYSAMDDLARATGGKAYYSNNGIAQVIDAALTLVRHAYTLTYTPEPYVENGAWHAVHLTVDGPYRVSYRLGYYADEPANTHPAENASTSNPARDSDDHLGQRPIVFAANVYPETHSNAATETSATPGVEGAPLTIDYSITAGDLQFSRDATSHNLAHFKVAVLAYDASGDVLSSAVDTITTHYSDSQLALAQRTSVPMLQRIRVRKGARFLLLAVVDLTTGRSGTVQLTLASAESRAIQP